MHSPDPTPVEGIAGLLAAFRSYPLVALGEAHWLQQEADFVGRLVQHPTFLDTVRNVVVEFGNAHYQPVVERYLAGGGDDADLLPALDTIGAHFSGAWRSPIYAQFFRTVRELNRSLPPGDRLRVWLGDPAVDWSRASSETEVWAQLGQRDAHYARVVEQRIRTRGERALLIAGRAHFTRHSDRLPPGGNVVQYLERHFPGSTFVVMPHVIHEEVRARRATEVHELDARLAGWTPPALAVLADTWLGEIDAYLHCDNAERTIGPDGQTEETLLPYRGPEGLPLTDLRLSDMVDALLYLGPSDALTFTPPAAQPVSQWVAK